MAEVKTKPKLMTKPERQEFLLSHGWTHHHLDEYQRDWWQTPPVDQTIKTETYRIEHRDGNGKQIAPPSEFTRTIGPPCAWTYEEAEAVMIQTERNKTAGHGA